MKKKTPTLQNEEKNYAFIDGQNLYMGTFLSKEPWKIDFKRFRVYLREKYKVSKAYYYIGCVMGQYNPLYEKIQEAGFIMVFRPHSELMVAKKKGNVDCDIILDTMTKLYKKEDFDKIVLVSGDGDFSRLVNVLIEENRFKKILFPNKKKASSLYKKLASNYYMNLNQEGVRKKLP